MTLSEIVSQLSAIQLVNTPECRGQVHYLVDLIFPLYWLHHPIKAGTIISRCRKDAPNLEKESFGCKPARLVNDFQRASVPHESVFYGAVGDRDSEDGDFIAMLESSTLHREGKIIGREEIFVSQWKVIQDNNMAIICHPNVFLGVNPNGAVRNMQNNYVRLLYDYPNPDLAPEFDKLVAFISSQFGKKVKDGNNYQYMISAYFAHNAFETEAGIIYPSVQVNGRLGFNVAIRPDIVDNSLEFLRAEKHVLYKANNYMQVPAGLYSNEYLSRVLDIDSIEILPKIE